MDPWNCQSDANNYKNNTSNDKRFEDNFSPAKYDKLPDSDEYLALLEAKLDKIKSDPHFLKQLADKREACMQQLLNSSDYECSDTSLNEPVVNSSILRAVMPQKQALTQGEIVELVKYDQLLNDDVQESVDKSDNQ